MASYTKEEEEKLKDNKNYIRDIPIACAILGMISLYMLRFFAVFKRNVIAVFIHRPK